MRYTGGMTTETTTTTIYNVWLDYSAEGLDGHRVAAVVTTSTEDGECIDPCLYATPTMPVYYQDNGWERLPESVEMIRALVAAAKAWVTNQTGEDDWTPEDGEWFLAVTK